jgi:hypothetical protein
MERADFQFVEVLKFKLPWSLFGLKYSNNLEELSQIFQKNYLT